MIELKSEFFDERDPTKGGGVVDTIVIHTMHNLLGGDKFDLTLCKGVLDHYKVSSHYFIDRSGVICVCVPEEKRAWHAGPSKMPGDDGRESVSNFSIGIELIGDYDSPLTDVQYETLIGLVRDIKSRRPEIKYIVGHSEIAPDRKTDPWNFDWERFRKGIA